MTLLAVLCLLLILLTTVWRYREYRREIDRFPGPKVASIIGGNAETTEYVTRLLFEAVHCEIS